MTKSVKVLLSPQKNQTKSTPETIEQAWIDESVKRLEAYHCGGMKSYFADDVIRELEKPQGKL